MSKISPELAQKFFSSLYAEPVVGTTGNFETMATRLIARNGDQVLAGEQALQGLMIGYALSNASKAGNPAKTQDLAASLAGIKQKSVTDFASAFPNADLNTLISAAKGQGFDVEVLKHNA